MRVFGSKNQIFWLLITVLLGVSGGSRPLYADDKESSNSSSKPVTVKIENPTPGLTERERWLLDRVEQLERRVAELEAKGQPAGSESNFEAAIGGIAHAGVEQL